MKYHVFGRSEVNNGAVIACNSAFHVSLFAPKAQYRDLLPAEKFKLGENWLHIACEDLSVPGYWDSPTSEHVMKMLDFFDKIPDDSCVSFNCEAGMSRSTAACLILMTVKDGADKAMENAGNLHGIRPIAWPNPVLIQYADAILGCEGKLVQASNWLAGKSTYYLPHALEDYKGQEEWLRKNGIKT